MKNDNEELIEEKTEEETEELVDETVDELSEIDVLQQTIDKLEMQNKELDEKYLRAYADAQNIAKRAKIDAENLVVSKVTQIVENILPALDNFERALNADVDNESIGNFLKGFEMIYQQLYMSLEGAGVKQIESIGQEFDPNYHQAIAQVNDENYDSNIVVEEVQKGYMFRDKVIRPAMVKINE